MSNSLTIEIGKRHSKEINDLNQKLDDVTASYNRKLGLSTVGMVGCVGLLAYQNHKINVINEHTTSWWDHLWDTISNLF